MAVSNTSLSVGAVLRDILANDAAVQAITQKVYPVATDKADLPYIVYRRTALNTVATKTGVAVSDSAQVEVFCYAATYADSIALAEAVRAALECVQHHTDDGLYMRSCILSDAEETWEDDAYVQQLTFNIRI